jgi:tetratricopeptide (TPR) repeat protein
MTRIKSNEMDGFCPATLIACALWLASAVASVAQDAQRSELSEAELKRLNESQEQVRKGADFYKARRFDRALLEFQGALKTAPNNTDALYNIGVCNTRLAEKATAENKKAEAARYLKDAQAAYEQLIALAPKHADALTNLGELFDRENDTKRAEECYRRALAADPKFGRALHNLGILLENAGKIEEAILLYRRHVELEDAKPASAREPYAYYSLGVALLKRGFVKDAKPLFLKARDLDPDSIYINNALGNVYIIEGNAGLALSHFQDAKKIADRNRIDYPPVYEGFGDVYQMRGETAKAKEAYQTALRLRPDFASVYFKLGEIAVKEKDNKRAIEYFQKYVKYGKDPQLIERVNQMIADLKR